MRKATFLSGNCSGSVFDLTKKNAVMYSRLESFWYKYPGCFTHNWKHVIININQVIDGLKIEDNIKKFVPMLHTLG